MQTDSGGQTGAARKTNGQTETMEDKRQINRQRERERQEETDRENEIENKSHRTHSAGLIAVCSTCTVSLHRFAALHALQGSRGGAWGFGVG